MTRSQIRAVLELARVPTAGQAVAHMLLLATLDGLLVRGPRIGDDHAFVPAADWLGERPKLDRPRALAELARRYLAGHGPADDRDLARWAKVTLRDARAGLQAIASELHERPDGLLQLRDQRPGPVPPPRVVGPVRPAAARLALASVRRRRRARGRHDERDRPRDCACTRARRRHLEHARRPGRAQGATRRVDGRSAPTRRRGGRCLPRHLTKRTGRIIARRSGSRCGSSTCRSPRVDALRAGTAGSSSGRTGASRL